jgi:hypothetical protein
MSVVYLSPTGTGDLNGFQNQIPGDGEEHWEDVDDPWDSPDNGVTLLYTRSFWEPPPIPTAE